MDTERARRFLSRPLGWAAYQVVIAVIGFIVIRVVVELLGSRAFWPILITVVVVLSVGTYMLRRRLGLRIWSEDDR